MNMQALHTSEGAFGYQQNETDLIKQFNSKLPEHKVLTYITQITNTDNKKITEEAKDTIPFSKQGTQPILPSTINTISFDRAEALQRWEGVVLEIKNNSLIARLYDLTNKGNEEEVELSLEEISDGDKELITPGAVFYWTIGYLDKRTGQRTRESLIRFRRLPVWQKKEIEDARLKAEGLMETIGWE